MGVLRAKAWAKQKLIREALLGMACRLGPNEQMPTVRELCSSFDISSATLNQALRSLESRGAITRQHGRGIYVSPAIHQKTIAVVIVSASDAWVVMHDKAAGLFLGVRELAARGCRRVALLGHDVPSGRSSSSADWSTRRGPGR